MGEILMTNFTKRSKGVLTDIDLRDIVRALSSARLEHEEKAESFTEQYSTTGDKLFQQLADACVDDAARLRKLENKLSAL